MVSAANRKMLGIVIQSYMQAEKDEDRQVLLGTVDTLLEGSRIRVYVDPSTGYWRVYVDAGQETFVPTVLMHVAHYVEVVRPDGTAQVLKGGVGPTQLSSSTEPGARTRLDILLGEDIV